MIKSKRFRQSYLNNKHDYLLDSNIILSSLKHKVWEMANKILLWGIYGEQDSILRYECQTQSCCERFRINRILLSRDTWRIGFYFQENADSRILLWDICDEQNTTVKDLFQKWFYFEGFMANSFPNEGVFDDVMWNSFTQHTWRHTLNSHYSGNDLHPGAKFCILLTATGLTPSSSSAVYIHTQTIYTTTQNPPRKTDSRSAGHLNIHYDF